MEYLKIIVIRKVETVIFSNICESGMFKRIRPHNLGKMATDVRRHACHSLFSLSIDKRVNSY